ncbi:MAG TPA: HEAT repeat domain-containing protein [Planctomycetota bacterium]|nr:HEAT repeat domain-containing protein [Planctomycetota bacterium]
MMMRSAFVLAVFSFSLLLHGGDVDPKWPKGPPGWKVEVIKQAPEVRWPSVLCMSPDGRIFVGEDPMDMPGPSNKPIDRVLCIHPDGKITVFAENLYAVFGIQYIDGKVYVHHCPKLTVFRDENGVGKDPVDLIDSTNPTPWGGTGLNDHIPANMRLAMDGYLYMSVGDKGIFGAVSNVDKKKAELFGGGILRIRPDGTDMEVYCTGTRNHLDVSINAEDEIFTYDNTDDGHGWWTRFTHMVDSGFYGYPYDYRPPASDIEAVAKFRETKGAKPYYPYTLWRMEEYGSGSPCGAVGYNDDALPEEYRGNLFHCEWGKSEVTRFVVERDGGSYKVVKKEPFLMRVQGELRPLGITTLPDGLGFMVADWHHGGWKNKQEAGRVIKISYTGQSLAAPKPAWYLPAAMGQKFNATTDELIAGLSHPAQSVRLVAQRRIAERGAEAVPMLKKVVRDNENTTPHARWSAIWTLDAIDGGKAGRDAILSVAKDEQMLLSVRMQAVRQLGTRGAKEATPILIELLDHSNAAMRFRAATALGRIRDTSAIAPLMAHLTEKDFFARFAIFTALNRIGRTEPAAWEAIVKGLNSSTPEIRDGCVYAMRNVFDEALIKALSNHLAQSGNSPEGRAAAIRALAPLQKQTKPWTGKWFGTQPFVGARPAREVEWAGTAPATNAINAGLKDSNPVVRLAALEALQIAPDPAAGAVLAELFQAEKEMATRKHILRAMAACKADAAAGFVAGILKDPVGNKDLLSDALNVARQVNTPEMSEAITGVAAADVSVDLLVATLDVMGKLKDTKAVPVLARRLTHEDGKVAEAAANALGGIKSDETNAALIAALKDKRGQVRRAAAKAIEKLKPAEAVEPLLAALKDGDSRKEVTEALAAIPDIRALDTYLSGLDSKDGGLRDKCKKAIKGIHEKALPIIEARLETNPLPTQVISDLQAIYKPLLGEGKDTGKLFKFDTKNLAPEAFAAFAKDKKGDAENGKKLFFAENGIGCYKCHKVGDAGAEIGPSLSGVGSKYDREKLIEAVLFPSKLILDGYQQSTIRIKDGQVYTGLIRGENETELTLIDANAQKTEIKKADIKLRKQNETSLMPDGLHATLKLEEFADLIAYMESLKEKK